MTSGGGSCSTCPTRRALIRTLPPRCGSSPAFDNAILGYQDRGRIIDDAHRGLSVAGERVVLVDGRVAATWRVTDEVVTVEPLRAFSRADREAVADQGRELASFLSDGESARVRVEAAPR